MAYLDKSAAIFHRNDRGQLIPQEVELELLEDRAKIRAIPMTRGKIKELHTNLTASGDTTKDQDTDIILNHCMEPKFTEQEATDLMPKFASAIVTAIISISTGIPQHKLSEQAIDRATKLQEAQEKK